VCAIGWFALGAIYALLLLFRVFSGQLPCYCLLLPAIGHIPLVVLIMCYHLYWYGNAVIPANGVHF
jgi:hypothetical protein